MSGRLSQPCDSEADAPQAPAGRGERLAELSKKAAGPEGTLSEREKEVLLLIAQGCTNKEIAARLFLSPLTARNHVIRILDKLALSRRSEAAVQAVRLGLVDEQQKD